MWHENFSWILHPHESLIILLISTIILVLSEPSLSLTLLDHKLIIESFTDELSNLILFLPFCDEPLKLILVVAIFIPELDLVVLDATLVELFLFDVVPLEIASVLQINLMDDQECYDDYH